MRYEMTMNVKATMPQVIVATMRSCLGDVTKDDMNVKESKGERVGRSPAAKPAMLS